MKPIGVSYLWYRAHAEILDRIVSYCIVLAYFAFKVTLLCFASVLSELD